MSLRNAAKQQTVKHEPQDTVNQDRGKRAEQAYAQLNVVIPKQLKLRFKSAVAMQESDMSEICEGLISDWLKRHGG